MRRPWSAHLIALSTVALTASPAFAQELEPGIYWPLPVGMNIVTAANSFNWGDVTFDPALPVSEASSTINTSAAAYTRALSIAGRSANVGVQLPVLAGHVEGVYLGQRAAVTRFGLGDPRFRLGINVYGAPAIAPRDFASYRLPTLVGVSLVVAPPLGQYSSDRAINLGTNRWSFKPELGVAHPMGPWVLELMGGVWLFTDNHDVLGGRTRSQDPIVSAQVHLTYRFRRTTWLAADANFYSGGRTTVGGERNLDFQRNSRVGSTFSTGLTRRQSMRLSVSRGAYTTIGAAFTSLAVSYNYAWVE
jgi:hypothetical protein